MNPESKKILGDIVSAMTESFWLTWDANVKDFPDTEEADYVRYYAVEGGIAGIIADWLLGFSPDFREDVLENFLNKLRIIEKDLRGIVASESEE